MKRGKMYMMMWNILVLPFVSAILSKTEVSSTAARTHHAHTHTKRELSKKPLEAPVLKAVQYVANLHIDLSCTHKPEK